MEFNKKYSTIIIVLLILISCRNSENKAVTKDDRIELIPEPDKAEKVKYEEAIKLKKLDCVLDDPDTSILGIDITESESAMKVIGEKDKQDEVSGEYHLYSKMERETLTLVQHPGDSKYQISIFKIEYSDKASYDYRQVKIDTFKTGKGIKLGMTKSQIIKKMGKCYTITDSTANFIHLNYRMELPNDSKAKILANSGMPTYYASYKFCYDKLMEFEFGFEYP